MMWASRSFNPLNPPLFHIGRFPVYVTTLMVMIHVVMMVLMALTTLRAPIWNELAFSASAIIDEFKIWKVFTYAIITPPAFMTALGLVFFFFFGQAVEERLGRKEFVKLYAILWLLAPLAVFFLHLISGRTWLEGPLMGSSAIHFSMFLALAFYHPDAPTFFMIPIKWLALFFVVVSTLEYLSVRYTEGLLALWSSILVTYIFLRKQGLPMRFGVIEGPLLNALPNRKERAYRQSQRNLRLVKAKRRPAAAAISKYQPKIAPRAEIPEGRPASRSVDAILEKISKQGIQSLTKEERKLLEEASADLSDSDRS